MDYSSGIAPDQLGAQLRSAVGGGFDPSAMTSAPAPNTGFASLLPSSNAKYVEQDGKHKGVAGTARDILGFLGDFLLTRLHMKPMYSTAQEDRKEHAAMEGFGNDPQSTADALSRLDDLNPTRADKVKDTYLDNQRLAQNAASIQDARRIRAEDLLSRERDRKRGIGASALNTLTDPKFDDGKRAALYPTLRAQVIKVAPELESELPPTYDANAVNMVLDSAVPLGLQRGQLLTEKRIDNQDEQAGERIRVTERGQDISSSDRAKSRDVTVRGQDISSSDRAKSRDVATRGQDIRSGDTRRGQDLKPRKLPTPSAEDIQYLQANPDPAHRARFQGRFGAGSDRKVLGK